jgi:hypothetical protein
MATFLDVAALEHFSKIFVFLLVVFILVAVFTISKVFDSYKWIGWIVAVIIGIFVVLSDLLTGIIRFIAPWFALVFIFVIFITIATKIFGANDSDFAGYKPVLIVVLVLVFVVGSIMYARTQVSVPGDIDEDGNVIKEENYNTTSNFIFHPKVLGIIFLLLVAVFTVALLAGKAS